MSLRERFGWNPFFEHQAASLGRPDLRFARIVEEQRGLYRIAGDAEGWAEVSGRFRHQALNAADFPAVGDWVGVDGGIIHVRLERRGKVSRAAAGRAVDEQIVAANVDVIFLVTTLTQDLNPRRLERYLTMVWDAGAVPVVVLNKADLCDDSEGACESVRARLPLVDVLKVSALEDTDLSAFAPFLRPRSDCRAARFVRCGEVDSGQSSPRRRHAARGDQRCRWQGPSHDDGPTAR